MHAEAGRHDGVELLQELLELLCAVKAVETPYDFPALQIQRRKEARTPCRW